MEAFLRFFWDSNDVPLTILPSSNETTDSIKVETKTTCGVDDTDDTCGVDETNNTCGAHEMNNSCGVDVENSCGVDGENTCRVNEKDTPCGVNRTDNLCKVHERNNNIGNYGTNTPIQVDKTRNNIDLAGITSMEHKQQDVSYNGDQGGLSDSDANTNTQTNTDIQKINIDEKNNDNANKNYSDKNNRPGDSTNDGEERSNEEFRTVPINGTRAMITNHETSSSKVTEATIIKHNTFPRSPKEATNSPSPRDEALDTLTRYFKRQYSTGIQTYDEEMANKDSGIQFVVSKPISRSSSKSSLKSMSDLKTVVSNGIQAIASKIVPNKSDRRKNSMRRSVSSVAIGNMNSFEGLSKDLRWQDGHVNVNINTIQTLSRNGVDAIDGKEVQRIDKTGLVFKPVDAVNGKGVQRNDKNKLVFKPITKPAQTTVRHGPLSQGPSRPLQRCTSDVWGRRRKSSMQTMSPLQMALISPDIRIRIEDIRDWFALQDYIRDRLDDEMILAFLHTCYYNVKEVRKRIIEYFHARSCLPNMLDFSGDPQLLSDSIQPVLDHFYICPLVHATRNEIIIYVKCASPEPPSDHEYTGYHRLLFSITEQCVRDHPTRDGFTFVFDSGNFAFGHFKKAGFKMATQLFNYYQGGLPFRVKDIYHINTSYLAISLFKLGVLTYPFAGAKLRGKVHFYKSRDMPRFVATVGKENVPMDYEGGAAPSCKYLYAVAVDKLRHPTEPEDLDEINSGIFSMC